MVYIIIVYILVALTTPCCMPKPKEDCKVTVTICLTADNNETVEHYKTFVRSREKKASFSKVQTINRIIKEWAEDRCLTLTVNKK